MTRPTLLRLYMHTLHIPAESRLIGVINLVETVPPQESGIPSQWKKWEVERIHDLKFSEQGVRNELLKSVIRTDGLTLRAHTVYLLKIFDILLTFLLYPIEYNLCQPCSLWMNYDKSAWFWQMKYPSSQVLITNISNLIARFIIINRSRRHVSCPFSQALMRFPVCWHRVGSHR